MASIIEAILGIKRDPFKKGLDAAKRDAAGFKKSAEKEFSGVGGALIGMGRMAARALGGLAIGATFKQGAEYAADLADQATQVGVSIERLQSINKVFANVGAGPEDTSKALLQLQQNIASALEGNQKARDSFAALGVSIEDLAANADRPDEILLKLSEGFAKADNRGLALAATNDLLGKTAKKLGGNFAGVAAGVREMDQSFIKVTDSAAKANDRMTEFFASRMRDVKAIAGEATGNAWQALEKIFSPSEWKNNAFGQQRRAEQIAPAAPPVSQAEADLAKMGIVQLSGESDEKWKARVALLTKPPAEIAKTDKELQDEKDRHDAVVEMQAAEGKGLAREEKIRKQSAEEYLSTQARIARLSADIMEKTERMKGPLTANTAELRAQVAELEAQRKAMIVQQLLMTPEQRREQTRADRAVTHASAKAERMIAHELREEQRRLKTGARRDDVRRGLAERRDPREGDVREQKIANEKLDTINRSLQRLEQKFSDWR